MIRKITWRLRCREFSNQVSLTLSRMYLSLCPHLKEFNEPNYALFVGTLWSGASGNMKICIYIYIYMYIYSYMCIYLYMYIYIYLHLSQAFGWIFLGPVNCRFVRSPHIGILHHLIRFNRPWVSRWNIQAGYRGVRETNWHKSWGCTVYDRIGTLKACKL